MRYAIDIEDEPVNGLYKAKNFNTLVFDQEGLNRLEPLSDCILTSDSLLASDVRSGDHIEVCGIDMDVLDTHYPSSETGDKYGVLCLSRHSVCDQHFDSNTNNWCKSALRVYLHNTYKSKLDLKFVDSLLPFKRDLLSGDGLRSYKDCIDVISILSVEEYRLYRQYIFSNPAISWWLLTAFSAYHKHKKWIQIVDPDGVITYSLVTCKYGIKPLFLLRPSTKVKLIS